MSYYLEASTSKNLNSDPAGASAAGDSSQNLTEIEASGSSGEHSGNPEPSQGGQVDMGVDLQQPPRRSRERSIRSLIDRGPSSMTPS
ncbi:hypothetical protein TSAR_016137 [Trichomalopsis sarcophagae]|uniref:Uncharacterized protein n=1 Tax=Trichomalopsis sarcophagae TaxID=543379 RepID=A0A232FI60_9HYME|nr:hypothetical protein TSAR_016137 [Trichomalopsis sarcophagae]